jgi:hypothetical protein
MKRIQFTKGIDPGIAEVLSPLTGQVARMRRLADPGYSESIILFPRSEVQLMRVPQVGYSLETLAFGICGVASFTLMLMVVLGVK